MIHFCIYILAAMAFGCNSEADKMMGENKAPGTLERNSSEKNSEVDPNNLAEESEATSADEPAEVAGAFLVGCAYISNTTFQKISGVSAYAACAVKEEAREKKLKENVDFYSVKLRANSKSTTAELKEAPTDSPWHVYFEVPEEVRSLNLKFSVNYQIENQEAVTNEASLEKGFQKSQNIKSSTITSNTTKLGHYIFVSSKSYKVGIDFKGVGGANQLCQNLGNQIQNLSHLNLSWRAVLSSRKGGLAEVFKITQKVYLPNGAELTNSDIASEFWDGKNHVSGVTQTEKGDLNSSNTIYAWTGSLIAGRSAQSNCNDWSSNLGVGITGDVTKKSSGWLFHPIKAFCSTPYHIYCMAL